MWAKTWQGSYIAGFQTKTPFQVIRVELLCVSVSFAGFCKLTYDFSFCTLLIFFAFCPVARVWAWRIRIVYHIKIKSALSGCSGKLSKRVYNNQNFDERDRPGNKLSSFYKLYAPLKELSHYAMICVETIYESNQKGHVNFL